MLLFFEYTLENVRVLFWQFKFEKRMFPGYSYGGANFDLTAWKLYIISILDRIEMSPVTLVLRFTFDGASAVFAFQYF